MTEKRKREKVVAEITASHVSEFAAELGLSLSDEEVTTFLNSEGRAYEMWKRMMHAAEEYVKSSLQERSKHPLKTLAPNPAYRRKEG